MARAATYYVTTYWQTDWIKKLRMIPSLDPDYLLIEGGGFYIHKDSVHLHKTLDAAKGAVSVLARRRIRSLQSQIERMRRLEDEPKVEGE